MRYCVSFLFVRLSFIRTEFGYSYRSSFIRIKFVYSDQIHLFVSNSFIRVKFVYFFIYYSFTITICMFIYIRIKFVYSYQIRLLYLNRLFFYSYQNCRLFVSKLSFIRFRCPIGSDFICRSKKWFLWSHGFLSQVYNIWLYNCKALCENCFVYLTHWTVRRCMCHHSEKISGLNKNKLSYFGPCQNLFLTNDVLRTQPQKLMA